MQYQFHIKPAGSNLLQLLKYYNIAETGGHAKEIISNGEVFVNGEQEYRLRRKLKEGDIIELDGIKIECVNQE